MASDELLLLRQRPDWPAAVRELKVRAERHGAAASEAARNYAQVYAGRRGAMVFDVVASRQRRYEQRVLPLVERWASEHAPGSLAVMATSPPDPGTYGLLASEPHTMRTIARNLADLANRLGVDEDRACLAWAENVRGLEHAHGLDPVVGAVKGIGPALFAYLRMRCGADALKPDVRVAKGLRALGFQVPSDQHSIMVVARAAATEIDFDLLALDQLLWLNGA
ncbi:hypothetical protein [Amycolatopsis minnesotensis]|uniref:3-methyladenine DNA glycosylase n=1 Tax=Amycolatopsis minnesotensis TaxID=337894 RepID=A0ABN2R248_9PSEU